MAEKPEALAPLSQLQGVNSLMDLDKTIDDLAGEQNLHFASMDRASRILNSLSTGSLSLDTIMGGGYAPGRFTYLYGPSQSCKSTILFQSIRETLAKNIQVIIFDHEGSVDPQYLENLGVRLGDVCGHRSRRGGWERARQLFYAAPDTGEETFRFLNTLLNALPYKVALSADRDSDKFRYFLIHPDYASISRKTLGPAARQLNSWAVINKGLKEKIGDKPAVVEVDDYAPQFVFMIDSLKSMLPKTKEEDLDNESNFLFPKMLHTNFPLIKSLLQSKRCNLIATNHLNINPMAAAKRQSPETEPGGSAVQYYPDTKAKLSMSRAQSNIIEEPHISGEGSDRYMLGHATIVKSKSGASLFRSTTYRLWVDERGDAGRGFCPVWDTYQFLEYCGAVEVVDKNAFRFRFADLPDTPITWLDFKKIILEDRKGSNQIRSLCKDMIMKGEAQMLLHEYMGKNPPKYREDFPWGSKRKAEAEPKTSSGYEEVDI